ncbi:MAG: hypothetical protein M0P69_00070 [Bacteroidales bacterium]|nr:hypothetical protein [Bacteroidales bacterium]MDD2571465.1 hypothetical protein [Bacteroidales bacterium]MDD2812482.1 hypothetical protein [Bacteroidales bacterium]MDD3384310.1 hypothetical protein [Bacteroidales bacterium]MDD3810801.1 hypothetical protein [Bacteroidales bacterium]
MNRLRRGFLFLLLGLTGLFPGVRLYGSSFMDRQGRDLAIIVDFPEKPIVIPHYRSFWNFWAHVFDFNQDGFGKVGHTAVILVDGQTGDLYYFDFGRYDDRSDLMGPRPEFYGTVRSARNVPQLELDIKAKIESDQILNLEAILIQLATKPILHGYDPIDFAVVPNLELGPMVEYARSCEEEGYFYYGAPAHLYCTSFVRKIISKGGKGFHPLNFTGQQTLKNVRKKVRQPYD